MNPQEVTEELLGAFNSGDFETAGRYLSDNFQFSGPVPEPISGQEWLGLASLMAVAFPDLQYNLRVEGAEGNTVKIRAQLTGTNDGDFDLTAMGMGVIPATGQSFSLPEEHGEVTIDGSQATSWVGHPVEGGGLMGILSQIGVEPPAM